ncbi:MAG: hypothetical protein ACREO9_04335, partial [Lysobacterales bacterium]
MNLAAREQDNGPEPAPAPAPEIRRDTRQASKLLSQLFGSLDTRKKLTILDVGRATPESVAFFSQLRCKIHMLDLYSELRMGHIGRDSSGRTLQRQFQD